jgi:endonuclease VIII
MAEGDSILRIARRFNETLAGSTVTVTTPGPRRPDGITPAEIDGRRLDRAESRGKNLLLHFDGEIVLHSHLGMRGSWQLYRRGERWRHSPRQAWIALEGGETLAVNFGGSRMRIATEAGLRRDPRLARLGPDLLAESFDPAVASARLRSYPDLEIGAALLGQRLVAGIGNIFKSEGCFAAGIDPRRQVGSLTDEELVDLLQATRALMLAAADTGRQPNSVYRRAGRPCPRCGTTIRSTAQGDSARISYWCPGCQPGMSA